MKKLKATALVAVFSLAMFQPTNVEARTKIKHVDVGNGCFQVVEYESILWGLITYGENPLGIYCLD